MYIIKMLAKELRHVADKLESNTCDIGEQEAIDIINIIAREPMSKQSAAEFMNMSIPTFDLHVAKGSIPKGKKRKGFKELVWYNCDLYECLQRLNR